jgi:hypothetical protein
MKTDTSIQDVSLKSLIGYYTKWEHPFGSMIKRGDNHPLRLTRCGRYFGSCMVLARQSFRAPLIYRIGKCRNRKCVGLRCHVYLNPIGKGIGGGILSRDPTSC